MKITSYICALLLASAFASEAKADALYNERVIFNVANIDLDSMSHGINNFWVPCDIQPSSDSGKKFEGIKKNNDGTYTSTEKTISIIYTGTLKPYRNLNINDYTYYLRQQAQLTGGLLYSRSNVDDFSHLFSQSGSAIIQLSKDGEFIVQPGSVWLIPSQWKDFFDPAFKFSQHHEDFFDLHNELKGEDLNNPLISIYILKKLSQRSGFGMEVQNHLDNTLKADDQFQISAEIYICLCYCDQDTLDNLSKKLSSYISSTTRYRDLKSISMAFSLFKLSKFRTQNFRSNIVNNLSLETINRSKQVNVSDEEYKSIISDIGVGRG